MLLFVCKHSNSTRKAENGREQWEHANGHREHANDVYYYLLQRSINKIVLFRHDLVESICVKKRLFIDEGHSGRFHCEGD